MNKVIFTLIFSVFAFSDAAQAFVFLTGSFNKCARPVSSALVWASHTLTLRVNTDQTIYGGTISPELTTTEFQSALNSAIAAWNGVCGSDVVVTLAGTTTNIKASGDLVNTVSWDNRTTAEGNVFAHSSTLAAAGVSFSESTLAFVDCDITVNGEGSGTFTINGSSSGIDLIGVLVHEIGHCLGLDHSVESPTYTSSNSILTNAVMKSSISAGSLTQRTLSQDEIDSMECVNSSTFTARSGNFCGSYHGTNGGAALSGVVSGGPSSSRACGEGISGSVTSNGASGSGCVTNAVGAEGDTSNRENPIGWFLLLGICLLCTLIFRFTCKLLLVLLLIPAATAQADVEISYQYVASRPTLINRATEFTSSEGTFTNTKADGDSTYKNFGDLFVGLTLDRSDSNPWGFYYKKNLQKSITLKGLNSAGNLLMTKANTLSGWIFGVTRKFYLFPRHETETNYFAELQLGLGITDYSQKLVDSSGNVSSFDARAIALDTSVLLGAQISLLGALRGILKLGYSRIQSNYFAAKSVSGTRFSSLSSGKRLSLQNKDDIKLQRGGFSASAGLMLPF